MQSCELSGASSKVKVVGRPICSAGGSLDHAVSSSATKSGSGLGGSDAASSNAVVTVVVNEVLCFAVGKFLNAPLSLWKDVLHNFYSEDELACAKKLLILQCEMLSDVLLPRYPKRKGDTRGKGIVDDISDILTRVDEAKCIARLPAFAAVDLGRVPLVKPEDMEGFVMACKRKKCEDRIGVLEA